MNYYMERARLFAIGSQEIKSREGTTQEDPTAIGAYVVGVSPLILFWVNLFLSTNTGAKKNSY